jgi:hypothetical protein
MIRVYTVQFQALPAMLPQSSAIAADTLLTYC